MSEQNWGRQVVRNLGRDFMVALQNRPVIEERVDRWAEKLRKALERHKSETG